MNVQLWLVTASITATSKWKPQVHYPFRVHVVAATRDNELYTRLHQYYARLGFTQIGITIHSAEPMEGDVLVTEPLQDPGSMV